MRRSQNKSFAICAFWDFCDDRESLLQLCRKTQIKQMCLGKVETAEFFVIEHQNTIYWLFPIHHASKGISIFCRKSFCRMDIERTYIYLIFVFCNSHKRYLWSTQKFKKVQIPKKIFSICE